MQNVLVHIGYHKTGTSWLQRFLFTREHPVFEPLSAKPNGHSTLARLFYRTASGRPLSPFEMHTNIIRTELARLANQPECKFQNKIPVISDERLSGNPHSGGFDSRRIAERIHNILPDAKILILIREQADICLSNYFQYLRVGGIDSLQNYLLRKYDGRRPGFTLEHFRYLPLVQHYHALYGTENVLVLPYEFFKQERELFFERLRCFLGREIHIPAGQMQQYVNQHQYYLVPYYLRHTNLLLHRDSVNSHSPLYLSFLKSPLRRLRNGLAGLIPSSWEQQFLTRIREQLQKTINDRFSETNQQLADLIGVDLARCGYQVTDSSSKQSTQRIAA